MCVWSRARYRLKLMLSVITDGSAKSCGSLLAFRAILLHDAILRHCMQKGHESTLLSFCMLLDQMRSIAMLPHSASVHVSAQVLHATSHVGHACLEKLIGKQHATSTHILKSYESESKIRVVFGIDFAANAPSNNSLRAGLATTINQTTISACCQESALTPIRTQPQGNFHSSARPTVPCNRQDCELFILC